jgi:hypothetical protein
MVAFILVMMFTACGPELNSITEKHIVVEINVGEPIQDALGLYTNSIHVLLDNGDTIVASSSLQVGDTVEFRYYKKK